MSCKIVAPIIFFLLSFGVLAADPYKINAGDILQIYVWNEETLNSEILVQPDGQLRFPMVGQVQAGGVTPSDVERLIVKGLGKYLKDEPVVTVSLRAAQGNKIYVLGNVSRPGEYPVNGRIDVMQALALAGGLNAFAAQNDIQIISRRADGSSHARNFPYATVKHGKGLESNIILRSGDTIVVP